MWFQFAQFTAGLTLDFLDWSSKLPHASIQMPDLPVWIWLCSLFGIGLLMLPRGMPGRPLGLLLLLPIWLKEPKPAEEGAVVFTLLDVGQGLSCVIETASHTLVYDTGPSFPSGFNTADSVLLPYLRSRGINKLDLLILSNHDQDHAGGVERLKSKIRIDKVLAGGHEKKKGTEPCQSGENWHWNGVDFHILHPAPGDDFSRENDASCVLKVESPGGRILLPGDIERKAESLLVERYGDELSAEVLIAPHHGSNSSSTQAFVQRVQPRTVLYPAGYRNRFGFPKQVVLERWNQAGAESFTTAESGSIQILLQPDQAISEVIGYRQEYSRYWFSSHFLTE
jgi:competence protein ComEC